MLAGGSLMEARQQVASWVPTLPPGVRMPGARALAALDGSDQQRATHALVGSALLALVQGGCTDEQAARIVESSPGLSWRVSDERRRGWGWLMARARAARQHAALHPPSERAGERAHELTAALHELASWVPGAELTGVPQLAKLRAVGAALIELAGELQRTEQLSVGCRELARRAAVHESTARKAVSCWQQVGLVELTAPGGGWVDGVQQAATYTLHLDALVSESSEPVLIEPGAAALVGHDAWRHGGLGHGAWAAWAVLSPDESSDPETLSELLSVRPRALREQLQRLAVHRLAVRTAGGWRRCTVEQAHERLQVAAVIEGTDGAGARALERHQLQRRERAYQRAQYQAHLRREHRRRETEHLVGLEPESVHEHRVLVGAPPGEPVPLAADGDRVLVILDELADQGAKARELTSTLRQGERRVHLLADQFPSLHALTQRRSRLSELGRELQAAGARMALWAEQHPDELAAARAAADEPGGAP